MVHFLKLEFPVRTVMYELSTSNVWVIKPKWESDQNTAALFPGPDLVCVVNGMSGNLWDFFAHKSQRSLKTTHGMKNKKGPKKETMALLYLSACLTTLKHTHTH